MSPSVRNDGVVLAPLERNMVTTVADVHMRAFPTFFLTVLGKPFLRTYYASLTDTPEAVTVVALDNGKPIGFAVGAVNPRGFYSRLLKRRWIRFGIAALPALLHSPGRIRRVLRATSHPGANPEGPDVAGLFSIAVDPSAQKRGIGKRVLTQFLMELRRRGVRRVFLTTDRDDNIETNAFYVAFGFRVERSFATPEGRWMNEYWIDLDASPLRT